MKARSSTIAIAHCHCLVDLYLLNKITTISSLEKNKEEEPHKSLKMWYEVSDLDETYVAITKAKKISRQAFNHQPTTTALPYIALVSDYTATLVDLYYLWPANEFYSSNLSERRTCYNIPLRVVPNLGLISKNYSCIGQGLQSGPTQAFSLWLSYFKTKISFGFIVKKSGVVF